MTAPEQFDPLPGHKIQTGPNILTVNDFECLRLDTYAWPSERVHCELQEDETWLWIVEHFDDLNCTVPNVALPVITHGTDRSGCFYFCVNCDQPLLSVRHLQCQPHTHHLGVARRGLSRANAAHRHESPANATHASGSGACA